MTAILVDSRVQDVMPLDVRMRCLELQPTAYTQASRFLAFLDGEAASPSVVDAVRGALLGAQAGHLLHKGIGGIFILALSALLSHVL